MKQIQHDESATEYRLSVIVNHSNHTTCIIVLIMPTVLLETIGIPGINYMVYFSTALLSER